MHGLFSIFMDEVTSDMTVQSEKIDRIGLEASLSVTRDSTALTDPSGVMCSERGRSSGRRPFRNFLRRRFRGCRTTSKLAALALLPLLGEARHERELDLVASSFSEHIASCQITENSVNPLPQDSVPDDSDCFDVPRFMSLNQDTHETCFALLSTAVVATIMVGIGKGHCGGRTALLTMAGLLLIPGSSSSDSVVPEIHLESSRSRTASQASAKLNRKTQNLSGDIPSSHKPDTGDAPQLSASRPPRVTEKITPRAGSHNGKRKNWATHVSAAYLVRKYQLLGIWTTVLLAACAVYWLFLREHIPPAWAAPFCLLIFVIGLLYNSESSNVVNEALTFVSGMAVFGVARVLSHRKVLHRCQCRMCEREVAVSAKLGEGSFGAVYKARTTQRAPEGAGVTCVVKRVPVDLDKDINDGERPPHPTLKPSHGGPAGAARPCTRLTPPPAGSRRGCVCGGVGVGMGSVGGASGGQEPAEAGGAPPHRGLHGRLAPPRQPRLPVQAPHHRGRPAPPHTPSPSASTRGPPSPHSLAACTRGPCEPRAAGRLCGEARGAGPSGRAV